MKTEFRVSGMHCSGCEVLLKEELQELEGVDAVRVSYPEGIVEVVYDADQLGNEVIAAVIGEHGFKVVS
ncbi:MAG: heavy-metal-associated domain-containing protein [Chlorobium sp.]|jgi:copper chaperone CopZ|uniref:heavy-metal-associated domain-containing protein n=1 Tax=Chlorobium sp. TaxID=1095 RepID=UPI0025C6A8C0|nr:heavy-metal-associated domain-containing protein [Chlorobium sp.]MCF8216093.1 heavy-metal-associated domain-containing protein [Chlorobium sp.]MCF8270994.1 heavy-metal-associated domain-containing protein [Chlorobium sp.]MCF8287360.1 heavy-metal-associated domain-containing protein [Chlorobium sp.]MCF8290907.1 heavy-metal-associated domain-containing protein [Chlorobium sp.]MCF8385002.1 heavy-metal-associated domain-containing protein [Chlorobium sp.]